MKPRSLINWMGNKKEIVDDILCNFPRTINNYFEPFIGGGIVLFNLLERVKRGEIELKGKAFCSDINVALVHMFINIQSHCDELIDEIKLLQQQFNGNNLPTYKRGHHENNKKGIDHKKAVFSEFRDEYNKSSRITVRDSALFIVIQLTSFRGCYKENRQGKLNITCQSDRVCKVDFDNIVYISQLIKDVIFSVSTYDCIQPKNVDDFIYLDPPYVKVNDNSFTRYSQFDFNDLLFFDYCKRLKCSFIMSNNDCEEIKNHFPEYKRINLSCNKTANHKKRNEILVQSN